MAAPSLRPVAASVGVLLGLTAVVVGLGSLFLQPSVADLTRLAVFLFGSGAATLAIGWFAVIASPFHRLRSVRGGLPLLVALVSALAIANVAFTAQLMFISAHDLALLALLLVFSLGVSVCLAYFLTLPFNASLRSLLEAVERMARGQLDTRIKVDGYEELRQLAGAVNSMAVRLEAAFARQQSLERARRQLVAAVSHDLRNPLASVRAMVESINDGVVQDRETIDRYLRRLQREVEYLSQLIDDLFELSQLDAGMMELQLAWASLEDVISDTLERVSAQAAQRRLVVHGRV